MSSKAELLNGLDEANSFTLDFHKLLSCGLTTAFFLCNNTNILREAYSVSGTDYIFHNDDTGSLNTGLYSLQCGRRNDAIKAWMSWQFYGTDGYKDKINHLLNCTQYFFDKISSNNRFKVLLKPQFLNVCFQVMPTRHINSGTKYIRH